MRLRICWVVRWPFGMGGDCRTGRRRARRDVAGADFGDEQAVQALECYRAVHVEEVGGEHGRGLCVQELPPGGVGVPFGRRRYLQCFEDAADRGGADPVGGLEELTLDPLVSPAVVFGGEPLDERGDLGTDRRPSGADRSTSW